ncbi:non-ribosomal peptide synthetase [Actinoplanes teichomyceticus]|uniref:non-ribosomal peptide synthetase n=1 Tax=Actinoplanes teichomyceticus TaxID=1867 RepID=UPI0011EB203E|nr:non-ribosomal peptide synthetase [Actinoplanes teichomyceticus]
MTNAVHNGRRPGPLRFCLTGAADLTVQCAEAILAAGHQVVLMVSGSRRVTDWAAQSGVPVLAGFAALDPGRAEADFDYLLSVVNGTILDAGVLALPRVCAINYHDAPLPRYAGVHATSWAILDGAARHGITWHVMTERVDGGAILLQRTFDVPPGASAFDLNLRCHEAALDSFAELLERLAAGTVQPREQPAAGRSYFGAARREPGGGLLSWSMPAEHLDRIVRAHTLGPVTNTLGTAKVWLDGECFVVAGLDVLATRAAAPAGTVLAVSDEGVDVSTTTRDVRLRELTDLGGRQRAAAAVLAERGGRPGARLTEPDESTRARYGRALADCAADETYCRRALERAAPVVAPVAAAEGPRARVAVRLPQAWERRRAELLGRDHAGAVVTALLLYLAQGGAGPVSVSVSTAATRDRIRGLEAFLTDGVPITLAIGSDATAAGLVDEVARLISTVDRRGVHSRDLPVRYRTLPRRTPPVGVVADADADVPPRWPLTLVVERTGRVWLDSAPTAAGPGYDTAGLERIAAGLAQAMDRLLTAAAGTGGPPAVEARDMGGWECGPRSGRGDADLLTALARRLAGEGERTAVVCAGAAYSYRDLDRRSAALAQRLRAAGAGPETTVAVHGEASAELIIACLAVLRAGAVYVPVDAAWPAGRTAAVLADARPAALVTCGPTAPAFDGPRLTTGPGDDTGAGPAGEWSPVHPDQAAYLMYTSGSTGRPKGVVVTRRGLTNRLLWWQERHPVDPDDVLLQTASCGFDISVWEILAGLIAGARVVVSEHRRYGIVPYLSDLLVSERVTVTHLVPSVLEQLAGDGAPGAGRGLRLVVTGGEVVTPALRDRCLAWTGATLVQAYGPTEASISVLHGRCRAGEPADCVPLGTALSDTAVAIVDGDGRRVPAGVAGELVVAGAALARGYHGRPAETAARFRPDALGLDHTGAGRVYHTGDRARYLPDGTVQFLGRVDDELKIHGHRVDPAAIEALLHAVPGVRRAVVRPATDAAGGTRLVAYVTGDHDDPAVLRAHLAEQLPQPLVPTGWVILDALPLTPTGKVDHRALPDVGAGGTGAPVTGRPPRSELERDLCRLWARLLGVAEVHPDDDFFALGGHSLVATRVIAAVWAEHDIRLTFSDVMGSRTVAALASLVQDRRGAAEAPGSPPPGAAGPGPEGPLALTAAQLRVLFEEEFLGGPGVFSVPVTTRWRGPVDEARLRAALNGLAARHPLLRAGVLAGGEQPRLVLADRVEVPFAVSDLGALPPAERDERLDAELAAMLSEPFELARPPLLRARLIRLGGDESVFAVVLHHLVCDRWSMEVLFDDLHRLYDAAEPPSPAAPDAVLALLRHLQARDASSAERDLSYWAGRLAGVEFDSELRVGRRAVDGHGHLAGSWRWHLPPELTDRLRRLCADRAVTPFMVLLAAFQTLLHRYSDGDDVVVGTPVADRDSPHAATLVGMLVNTVPLHAHLGGDPSFAGLLDDVRRTTLAALEHHAVPIDQLSRRLGRRRGLGHHPLIRYLLVWEDSPGVVARLPGVVAEARTPPVRVTAFDLTLIARADQATVGLELEFNRDRFDEQAARLLASSFTDLLRALLADPDARVGAVALAPLLPDGSAAVARPAAPDAALVVSLVEAAIREHPTAVCLVDGARQVSYAELGEYADAVAAAIGATGAAAGSVVGVCLPRSAAFVGTLLGVLKSGAAFLPLDPGDPDQRLHRQLAIGAASAVVTGAEFAGRFAGTGLPVVDADAPAAGPPVTGPSASPHDPAYVIFTSGSSGEPKGVVVENHSFTDHVRWAGREFGLGPQDRVLQFCAPTFDVMVEEIFPTLCAGARLVLRSPDAAGSVEALTAECARSGVTVVNLPTGYWTELTAALADGDVRLPSTLRLCVIGGEQVPAGALGQWHARVAPQRPDVRLLNAYGPTETTVGATVQDLTGASGGDVAIGAPIPGTRIYVLDRYLSPVPDGVVGELCIAGASVARGYAARPGLTAERFLPDPLVPGERMFRTGDLGYRRGGVLYFVGRADRQVKLRGFRIEPDEIERALAAHPLVREAAVLVAPGAGGPRLVAFAATSGPVEADTLRTHLAGMLPGFMLPTAVRTVPALPRTAAGKVDHRALPLGDLSAERTAATPAADEREQRVCAAWAAALGVEQVGVDDDFFALGGHSLLAMRLVRQMQRLGYPGLTVRTLFEFPTIAGLRALRSSSADAPAAVADRPPVAVAPLSWTQLGIWLQASAAPSSAYHMPVVVRLTGPLDVDALRAALTRLTDRHDVLRCAVTEDGDEPALVPRPRVAVPFVTADLAGPLEQEVHRLVTPLFDLRSGPPLRATLLRDGPGRHVLVLVIHHIAADGWSAQLVVDELAELYAGDRPAPPRPGSFVAYAAAERAAAPDTAALQFWRRTLDSLPEQLDLPADRSPRRTRSATRHVCRRPVPEATVRGLREIAREHHATLFLALLAVTQAWLARCCRSDDIVVGTPVAVRDEPELHTVVGPLVTMVPARVAVHPYGSFADHLTRSRRAVLDAFDHKHVPAQRIAEEALGADRARLGNPLTRVVFDVDEAPEPATTRAHAAFAARGLHAEVLVTPPVAGAFDLEVTVRLDGRGGTLEVRGADDLFSRAQLEHLVAAWTCLAGQAAADPGARLADLDLLEPQRRREVLSWAERAPRRQLPAGGVAALVAARAAATPDAPAVRADERRLTYRELDDLADRVAGRLLDEGLPVEGRVAVGLGRSAVLPAVVLGIWRAGGVYVPLDPQHPAARLRQIIDDCRPYRVVTDRTDLGVATVGVAELSTGPADRPRRTPDGDQLAYLTYTSGSTGEPKGVMCTHRGLLNQLLWSQDHYPLEPGQSLLQVAATGFDISLWEMFHPLVHGGRLVVLPEGRQTDVPAIAELVAGADVAVVHLVPTLLDALLSEPLAGRAPHLRHVVCGGERMPAGLPRRFARWSDATLHHTYGPTEASIIVTHHECAGASGPPPLGEPVTNTRIYVLDAAGAPVPPGVVGEIHIAGDGLARGYLHRPAATAAVFVPDPYAGRPGARMYRTGDLGRHGPDGTLHFVGRIDRQLKQGGVRVEPAEVEHVLAELPGVSGCAVVPRDTPDGRRVLVGYLVASRTVDDPVAWCRQVGEALRERLPRALVPAALEPVDALPLGVNGKLDVAALPPPARWGRARTGRAAATEVERLLAEVWTEVLPTRAVGADDNFFEAGGDSVSAIRMVARARAAGLRLDVGQVLRSSSLAELAALARVEPDGTAAAEVVRPGDDGPRRLWPTPAQAAFLDVKHSRPHHFNQACLLQPREPLDPVALHEAMRAVAVHHEALRLRLTGNGELVLADAGQPAERLARLVVAAEPLGADLTEAARPVHEGMDLADGPLFGALLGQRRDGSRVLLLAAHHLAVDTASWDEIVADLESAYRAVTGHEPVRLPAPPTTFGDLAAVLPRLAELDAVRAQEPYWREQLGTPAPLPADEPGPAPAAPLTTRLDRAAGDLLLSRLGRHRVRIEEALLTGVAQTVAEWTGDREVALLREAHGRDDLPGRPDVTRTVGWLTSVHPLRLVLPEDGGPVPCLRAVRQQVQGIPAGGVGYGLLRRYGDDPQLRAAAEPEITVNYLGSTAGGAGTGLLPRAAVQDLGEYAADGDGPQPALELLAGVDRDGIWAQWRYDGARLAAPTVRRLADELWARLRDLADALAGPVGIAATPADHPDVDLTPEQLRAVLADRPGARQILPLAPAQQGMLAHSLAQRASSAYHTQMVFAVEGEVDEAALRSAWQTVCDRFGVFRTAFLHDGLDDPVQVVYEPGSCAMDWRRHERPAEAAPPADPGELPADPGELPADPGELPAVLGDVLAADRAEPFRLDRPRPARWHWVDAGSAGRWLVWSHHHILVDGWSLPVVLEAVADAYATQDDPVRTPPAVGYAEYLRWLRRADREADAAYWRQTLADATSPARFSHGPAAAGHRTVSQRLAEPHTARLARIAERHRVTLNTLVLSAWSVLLRRQNPKADVVFGVTMSLRPDELADVERLVGLCLVTVPLRVPLTDGMDLPTLFGAVQDRLVDAYQHARNPPRGLADGLLDSVVVFENYPGDRTGQRLGRHGRLRAVRSIEPTEFPITLIVSPGAELTFELTAAPAALDAGAATAVLGNLVRLLERIATALWEEPT